MELLASLYQFECLFNTGQEVPARAISPEEERMDIQTDNKEAKLSLFADNVMLNSKKLKN